MVVEGLAGSVSAGIRVSAKMAKVSELLWCQRFQSSHHA